MLTTKFFPTLLIVLDVCAAAGYQMRNNTLKGDKVLDLFGGSGTSLIAAERSERIACLMELDPKYCDVIIKRWEDYTGHTAELIE